MKPLVVFDLANNHDGSIERGIATLKEFSPLVKEFDCFRVAVKLQFRSESMLHPTRTSKQVERFRSTMLGDADRKRLVEESHRLGYVVGCTPFDEESVEMMRQMGGFDFLKIASCSITDWTLLERAVLLDLPTIASTAGASEEDVGRASQFLSRRVPELTLLHCVALYPTPLSKLRLDRIDGLTNLGREILQRFKVGYSTHEMPGTAHGVTVAASKGCRTFEWHIGLEPRNSYSLSVEQCRYRMTMIADTLKSCEDCGSTDEEQQSLRDLRRGVYARRDICAGELLTQSNTVLQLPVQDRQITANDFGKYDEYTTLIGGKGVQAGEPILWRDVFVSDGDKRERVQAYADKILALLKTSGAVLPRPAKLILSHHKGLDNFERIGCGMIEVVNGNGYAKKIIIMLPGQRHPSHRHTEKDETFHILYGHLRLNVGDATHDLRPGHSCRVRSTLYHSFSSEYGCVLEEISSALVPNDSEYAEEIDTNRKTEIWIP
jgi:sialic acid synthase SpsE/mannose-6-phosphate isomerase-like protein (cupin superfamily)